MAELKQMDVGLGPLHYFEWPCGHRFHQNQECPACADERHIKLIFAQSVAYGTQLEKRNQVLKECREYLNELCAEIWIDDRSSVGTKLVLLQRKINEVLKNGM